jgi:TP901 family phage tail tape measure protein
VPFKELGVDLALRMSGFRAGLGQAAQDVRQFGTDIGNVSQASSKHLSTVGTQALILGGGLVAGFGLAAHAAMDFEQQLSNLQGVSGATSGEMGKLRQQALDAGAATVFSASQAVEAQSELAKAGVSTADILGGALTGALNLASAGSLSLADAATIAANAMTTFHLRGADVTDVADTLAAGANKSAANVDGMSQSLQQSGLVASQFGLDLHETVGVLSLFAQNGLKGSDAGTSFKTMLQRLVPQSAEARDMMKSLGIDLFDGEGNFVGIADAAQQFHDKLGPLTQEQRANALQTIFGADAIRAASILYQAGASGVNEWTAKVNDSGYAAELAATKMDNLAGDVENLKGSFETALIQGGSQATNVLRDMTQGANSVVQGFIALPPILQGVGVGLTGISGGGLLVIGAAATMFPKIQQLQVALEGMGRAGQIASTGISMVGKGIAVALPGITAGLTLLGNVEQAGREAVTEVTKDFKAPTSYRDLADQINITIDRYNKLKEVGSGSNLESFGQNINPFSPNTIEDAQAGARELEKLINQQQEGLGRWRDASLQVQAATGLTSDEVDRLAQKTGIDLTGAIDQTVPALTAAWNEMQSGTANSQELGGAFGDLSDKTLSVSDRLKAMSDAMKAVIDTAFGLEASVDSVQSKLNDLPDLVKDLQEQAAKAGQSMPDAFNGTSDAAIALREQMRGIVGDAADVISQWEAQGITGDELTRKMDFLRQSIINQAAAYGVPREEAERYLGTINLFPGYVTTVVSAYTYDAEAALNRLHWQIVSLQNLANQDIIIKVTPGVGHIASRWGNVIERAYAAGGIEQAHVGYQTRIKAFEPETGGEAYVPRLGNRDRSMAIMNVAAGWYGAKVVPMANGGIVRSAGQIAGGGAAQVVINPTVVGEPSAMARAQFERSTKKVAEDAARTLMNTSPLVG